MTRFESLVELIRRRVGIDLSQTRDVGSLERFVDARVKALGLQGAPEYVDLLEQQTALGPELTRVITAVTNPHTFFFRDETQFRAAAALLARLRGEAGPFTVWSAGCATGEEPYTLAMICVEQGLDVHVLATDINRESLDIAREGRFKEWSLRRCPRPFVERYFTREAGDTFRVAEAIRARVAFERHNLVDDAFPSPATAASSQLPRAADGTSRWDCIFCRNVLMYFHKPAAQRVIEGFARSLEPEGWLFLSTSEHLRGLLWAFQLEEVEGTFAFRLGRAPRQPGPAAALRDSQANLAAARQRGTPSWGVPAVGATEAALRDSQLRDSQLRDSQTNLAAARSRPGTPSRGAPAVNVQIESTRQGSSGREQTLQFRFEIVQREPARTGRPGPGRELDLYSQALAALGSGDLPGARALLQQWIGANPEHTAARITLGNLLLRAHDLDGALAVYEKARERDPLLPEIHYLQGVVYRKLGDLTRAIQSFRHALFLDPRFWSAAFMLAGAQGRAGNVELQQRDLRRTLELLEGGEAAAVFSSYVEGMKDVCISPDEALRHCRRELGLSR